VTPEELRQLIAEGESETVEFKSSLPRADVVARDIAALANTGRGGTLVIGVNEREPSKSGIAHPGVAAGHVAEWVEQFVVPPPQIETEMVSIAPGQNLAVVTIAPSDVLHVTKGGGGAFTRRGAHLVPMQAAELRAAAEHTPQRQLAEALVSMQSDLEELRQQGGWPRQVALLLTGTVTGAIVAYLLGLWNPLH